MYLLELESVSLSFGSNTLVDSMNATLNAGDRVGLVGKNGCGKSTLLRYLAGTHDEKMVLGSGSVSGTLSPSNRDDGSVLMVNQDTLSWNSLLPDAGSEEEIREMSICDALNAAVAMSSSRSCVLDDIESWRRLCVAAGEKLGWNKAKYESTPIAQLSPGCALRAYLAIALRRLSVELLLLDEPTNFLDVHSILWLQHTILASDKAMIIVSHDEAFLDAVANRVWCIDDDHTLSVSSASYSAFMRGKRLAREQQQRAHEAQQQKRKKMSSVANKLRSASVAGSFREGTDKDKLQRDFKRDRAGRSGKKAKVVQNRLDNEEIIAAVVERPPLKIEFEPIPVGFDSSVCLSDVLVGHDGVALPLPKITLRIDFGESVAVIGANGVGKSTTLQAILGHIAPVSGTVSIGRELRISSLHQEHSDLPREQTPREYVASKSDVSKKEVVFALHRFGLTQTQVDQPIAMLNPGARVRLLIALFAIRRANVLVLDEPSSHMDDEALVVLTKALATFAGLLIVVSHDRSFLEALKLSRVLLLSDAGLTEVDSFEEYIESVDEIAKMVVEESM